MRAIVVLLGCTVCTSHARRVQPRERKQNNADDNPFASVAHLLLAITPANAFTASGPGRTVPGGPTHGVSFADILDSQRHPGHIDMLLGDADPVDVYASRMDDNLRSEDVIDVQATKGERLMPKPFAEETDYDVIIVGAGCAGIGTALMLTRNFGLDLSRVLLIEQGKNVGESFRQWPKEMRFISPSFNQAGWTSSFDLNSISCDTSLAFSLMTEHPTGKEYATYLEEFVRQCGFKLQLETKVTNIRDMGKGKEKERDHPGPFRVEVSKKEDDSMLVQSMTTRYVVWAAGEFQYPKIPSKTVEEKGKDKVDDDEFFLGAELCLHNTHVQSWATLPGDEFIIIGGYESGMDAAINLAKNGKNCKVLASSPCWNLQTGDPSSELAPYTAQRMREVLSKSFEPKPKLSAPLRVVAVQEAVGGGYDVTAVWKDVKELANVKAYGRFQEEEIGEKNSIVTLHTKQPPILCNGFVGSVAAQASHLFEFPDPELAQKGCIGNGPLLTLNDESTKVPGVFLVGPSVTHGELSFCFVYKFRQRFAVVANAICKGLGMDTAEAVAECRQTNMYLDDFAVCESCVDC
jgi:thioredoxin reductase